MLARIIDEEREYDHKARGSRLKDESY
ncbi:BnaUnng03860D [Brassica napus]|uniref:BnaUnng03860D protein n=1 Tax=Brassica napus TaxID=3708 RepID=A0A078JXU2_BRANA|nr:BnaUnng03860D [Brassica napus]